MTRSAAPTNRSSRTPSPGPGPQALQWRTIRDAPGPASRNMATDHALACSIRAGTGVLRLYRWERRTVSFGRNEAARGLYSVRAARRLGVDYVRRPTGGRAVLHADELTYAVVTPVRALGGARRTYRLVNEALARALRSLGASVDLAADGPAARPDAGPCFESPAGGEIVASGRKLVGSAQARIGGALLQHGSIILSGDQSALSELSGSPPSHRSPAALGDLIDDVCVADVADAVTESLARVLGGSWAEGACSYEETAHADRLEEERYAQDSWTWRR